jgi:hypothetical protein
LLSATTRQLRNVVLKNMGVMQLLVVVALVVVVFVIIL